jgi:hypothetical protein
MGEEDQEDDKRVPDHGCILSKDVPLSRAHHRLQRIQHQNYQISESQKKYLDSPCRELKGNENQDEREGNAIVQSG